MKRKELSLKWVLRDSVQTDIADYGKSPVRGSWDVVPYLAPWATELQEVLVVLFLDCRMRVFGHKEVCRGTMTTCVIDMPSIFRAGLMAGASALILAHNHPSGDVTPSQEDITATITVKTLGTALNLPVIDHVIVGMNADGEITSRSMRDMGHM